MSHCCRTAFLFAVLCMAACGTIEAARSVNVRGVFGVSSVKLRHCDLRVFNTDGKQVGSTALSGAAVFQYVNVRRRPWPKPDEMVKLEIDCNDGAEYGSRVVIARDLYDQREIEVVLTSRANDSK